MASRLAVEVSWTETIGIVSGSGTGYFWHLIQVDRSGDNLAIEHRSCGFQLPELMGSAVAGGLRVLQEVHTESFESPAMPKAVGMGRSSDAMLTLEPGPIIIGLDLADPLGPWPTDVASAGTPLDPDGDGKPGLTMFPKGGEGFSRPPTSITQSDRAEQLYAISRQVFSIVAPDPDCGDTLEGVANITFLNQLVVGCHTEAGAECTASEADFIEQARPKLVPGNATWSGQVVPDTATCVDVRSTLVMPGP